MEAKSKKTSKEYNTERIALAAKNLPDELSEVRMADMAEALVTYGLSSPSTIYAWVKDKTSTEPVKYSARCTRFPVSELRIMAAARSAGVSNAELRVLVAELHAARQAKLARLTSAGS